MKISKDCVPRASIGFLGYRCGTAAVCKAPSQDTMRKLRNLLDSEYPTVEIGLSAGLPLFFVASVVISCIPGCRRKQQVVPRGAAPPAAPHSAPPPYASV